MPHVVCVINDFSVCVCVYERVRARHCWNSNNNICMKLFMSSCRSCWQCQSCCWCRGWCFACLTLTMWMTITSRRGLCLSHSLTDCLPDCFLLPLALPLPRSPTLTILFLLVYLLVLTRFGLSRQAAFAFCLLLYFYYFRQSRFVHPLSTLTHSHTHTLTHTRTHTYLYTCQQKSFTLHCFTQFGWFLLAAYFLRVFFSLISSFVFLFEFTANLLQIVCKVCSPFVPRCRSKLKSSAKQIWNSFTFLLSAQLELVGHWPKMIKV